MGGGTGANQVQVEYVACDLCGADDYQVLHVLPDMLFGGPGEFPVVRCRRCGLIYVNPRPIASEMSRYYPHSYTPYKRAIEDERSKVLRWFRRHKLLARLRQVERITGLQRGRLLDVGCATGLFIHEAARQGWQVEGVEFNSEVASYARVRLGLAVHHGTLESLNLPAESYDVITFWDVLEHTFSPSAVLRKAYRLLRPGGWVIILIPNSKSLDASLFGSYWNGFDVPRHLYVFSHEIMERLLQKAGFSEIGHRCYFSGFFTFRTSLRRWLRGHWPEARWRPWMERLLDVPGVRFPLEPLFWLADRIERGPAVTFWARKPQEEPYAG